MWNKSILTTATKNLAVPLSRLCRSVMGSTQSGYTRFRWWNGTCRAAAKLKPYTQCRSKAKSGAPGPNKSRAAIEGSRAANKKHQKDIREGRNAIRDKARFSVSPTIIRVGGLGDQDLPQGPSDEAHEDEQPSGPGRPRHCSPTKPPPSSSGHL